MNQVYCPKCGAVNEAAAGFCDQCGTPLAGAKATVGPAPMASVPMSSASVCPSCSAAVIPGEAFCDNCGAAIGGMPPMASPAGGGIPMAPSPYPVQPAVAIPQSPIAPPPVFAAARLIAASGQTYQLAGKTTYLLGRTSDMDGIYPEVDTGDPGMQAGVSRRHAEISTQGMQWFVKDLNSVNGTWVNNQRLAPNLPQPVNTGDQIRLAKWTATFQI